MGHGLAFKIGSSRGKIRAAIIDYLITAGESRDFSASDVPISAIIG
jgi:hypothetical protein